MTVHIDMIGFGGGCHWCTEAVFQALVGVTNVAQGFIKSDAPNDGWSEAVVVTFDPARIDLSSLIEIHLHTHSSTSDHKLRGKYRSAVYTYNGTQFKAATKALAPLQTTFEESLVTQVLPHRGFRPSDDKFQRYYATNPDRPFCRTYIDPKLRLLRQKFDSRVK